MITGKESTDLLLNLLIVHLAPTTKAQIDRALKAFRQIRGTRYPITLEQLQEGIVITPAGPTAAPAPIAPPVALSTADRSEASTSAPEEGDEDDEA
jgi:hypothetical protein